MQHICTKSIKIHISHIYVDVVNESVIYSRYMSKLIARNYIKLGFLLVHIVTVFPRSLDTFFIGSNYVLIYVVHIT